MIVISREEAAKLVPDDACVILTGDTLIALQELSHWYISRFDMKKVAVTGSVGKTTTRDMIYAILRRKYITGASKANLNSESGMPLALLGFTHEMQAAVIEMGMDGAGQIRRLAEIAGPDMAVITNIGISHIEILGSRENIFKAKMEIAERFSEENTLVINSDDDYLATLKEEELPYKIVGRVLQAEALSQGGQQDLDEAAVLLNVGDLHEQRRQIGRASCRERV